MGTNKLKKIMKNAENLLAAVSFAEEGESEAARSFMNEGRRVLLAVNQGSIDTRTVKYAINTAKRISAGLDILYVSSGDNAGEPDAALDGLESALSGERIPYRLIRKAGCLKKAVIDYTNREKEILFAVVESANSLDVNCNKKDMRLSELWQKLKCPLVVVMDAAGA